MIDVVLGVASLGLVMVGWGTYMATIPKGNVPVRPIGTLALQSAGIVLAVAAIAVGLRTAAGLGATTIALSAVAMVMGALFIFLMTQAKTPANEIRVEIGEALPSFTARTSTGDTFTTDELAGKRVLLKFFRGGW
jgi:hypothetical protein